MKNRATMHHTTPHEIKPKRQTGLTHFFVFRNMHVIFKLCRPTFVNVRDTGNKKDNTETANESVANTFVKTCS